VESLLAQRSENNLVGAPVGVMDPLASSLADEHTAVFIDTRSLRIERIPLPRDVEIAIIDSGVSHASGGYALRRQECAMAAKLLGVPQLRDAYALDKIEQLPEPLHKRARHVVSENARVDATAAALEAHDLERVAELLDESHASLRDDYEASVPEVERTVAKLKAAGAAGARMVGGGFGGSVLALLPPGVARPESALAVAPGPPARLL